LPHHHARRPAGKGGPISDIDWAAVEKIDAWLDSEVGPRYQVQPIGQDWARVAKAGEEVGDAIDALIGITGQNPHKGLYGTQDDLANELADVALTGIFAIQHFTKDTDATRQVIQARLARILARVPNGCR
jgi:hypothetical protein